MFFDDLHGLLRVAIISPLAYAGMVLVLRSAGKRSLAKLNAFDLVVTVALGSTLATVLLSKDVALGEGVLAFAALASLQWLVSRISVASAWFRTLVRAEPRLLFENGKYRRDAMHAAVRACLFLHRLFAGRGLATLKQSGIRLAKSEPVRRYDHRCAGAKQRLDGRAKACGRFDARV